MGTPGIYSDLLPGPSSTNLPRRPTHDIEGGPLMRTGVLAAILFLLSGCATLTVVPAERLA
jgi:hypothetical protein